MHSDARSRRNGGLHAGLVLVVAAALAGAARSADDQVEYLLPLKMLLKDTAGKVWDVYCPVLRHQHLVEPVATYLHFTRSEGFEETYYVHFSKIRDLYLQQAGRFENRGISVGKVAVQVVLDDGTRLSGVFARDRLVVEGQHKRWPLQLVTDRPSAPGGGGSFPTTPAAIRFESFAYFRATPSRAGFGGRCVEFPSPNDDVLSSWQETTLLRMGLRDKPLWPIKTPAPAAVKTLTREQAAKLWEARRLPGQRWTVQDGDATQEVEAFGYNWLFFDKETKNAYAAFTTQKRVEFKGKVRRSFEVEIEHESGRTDSIKVSTSTMQQDFVFMWKTPYGFAGRSVLSDKKLVFTRVGAPAPGAGDEGAAPLLPPATNEPAGPAPERPTAPTGKRGRR